MFFALSFIRKLEFSVKKMRNALNWKYLYSNSEDQQSIDRKENVSRFHRKFGKHIENDSIRSRSEFDESVIGIAL